MPALSPQKRIGWIMMILCLLLAATNGLGMIFEPPEDPFEGFLTRVVLLALIGLVAWLITLVNHPLSKALIVLFFLVPSGPTLLTGGSSFFGMWMFIIAVTLIIKLGPVPRFQNWFLAIAFLYFVPWLYVRVVQETGATQNLSRVVGYLLFLLFGVLTLYFLFEEEIRDLLAANKRKDVELAEKEAEIARLEPLSTLGERVAHVAHSFKNNLSLLGIAQLHLEQGGDTGKALQKLQEFSRSLHERIDNILMVSRAGADQSEEIFDAARVLTGLHQVYLTEPLFLEHAKVELEVRESTPVKAIRWDFLLLVENILKNALEALTTKGDYGSIRVTLNDRVLTIANDGGAMTLCHDCHDDCLNCARYGRPGQTTKPGGSGHGLAQVFATCRKYGWTCRIRTRQDWTIFEIGFAKPDA